MRILVSGGSGFVGTRLVHDLVADGHEIFNLDTRPPREPAHKPYWRAVNLANGRMVQGELDAFGPHAVVHLAARTDTLGRSLSEYRENIDGTNCLIEAIKARGETIDRFVLCSSQFVHQGKTTPAHDEDFAPHTYYGQSKVANEQALRATDLSCAWVIIRPTNIWGPWHPRYPTEFWRVLKKGQYFHPGRQPVFRSYGYVGNVSYQIRAMLDAPRDQIDRQVFYVGDAPIDLLSWVNGFSRRLTGREVRIIPRPALRALAVFGDLLSSAGIRFPLTSSRFESMTTDNPAPMEKTLALFGTPPYDLDRGIDETVSWLISQDPEFWAPKSPPPRATARGVGDLPGHPRAGLTL